MRSPGYVVFEYYVSFVNTKGILIGSSGSNVSFVTAETSSDWRLRSKHTLHTMLYSITREMTYKTAC